MSHAAGTLQGVIHMDMPNPPHPSRWHTAAMDAARRVLVPRWRSVLDSLEAARAEHAQLRRRTTADMRMARRAARRVQELEHLRAALAREILT